MKDAIRQTYSERPVVFVIGIALCLMGIALGVISFWKPEAGIVGNLLVLFGSVLASYCTAEVNAESEANSRLTDRIDALARILGTTVGQMDRVVEDFDGDSVSPVVVTLMSNLTRDVEGIVDEMNLATGTTLVLETRKRTRETIAKIVQDVQEREDVPNDVKQILTEELLKAESVLRPTTKSGRPKVREHVKCPGCNQQIEVLIGALNADTSTAVCDKCSLRFWAHRNNEGKVFVSESYRATRKHYLVKCPECSRFTPFNIWGKADASQSKFCLGCCARISIDPASGEIKSVVKTIPADARIVNYSGGKPVLECPDCKKEWVTYWKDADSGTQFASCRVCDILLRNKSGTETHVDSATSD